jgi:hypothetical protein
LSFATAKRLRIEEEREESEVRAMDDNALDRMYETITDLQSGDIDAFRSNVMKAFRQLVEILKEQQRRTRNQAHALISLERDVGEMKKSLKTLIDALTEER